jgi:hypothetical protein
MATKRGSYQRPEHPWLVIRDMSRRLLEHSHHPAGGRAALRAKLEALTAAGWTIEDEPTYDASFCHRGAERIHVSLEPGDPCGKRSGYGW